MTHRYYIFVWHIFANLAEHRGLRHNSFGGVDFSTREDEHTSGIHGVYIIVSLLLAGGGEIIAPIPAESAFIVQPLYYYDSSFSLLGSSHSLEASQSWVSIKNWPSSYGCKRTVEWVIGESFLHLALSKFYFLFIVLFLFISIYLSIYLSSICLHSHTHTNTHIVSFILCTE